MDITVLRVERLIKDALKLKRNLILSGPLANLLQINSNCLFFHLDSGQRNFVHFFISCLGNPIDRGARCGHKSVGYDSVTKQQQNGDEKYFQVQGLGVEKGKIIMIINTS